MGRTMAELFADEGAAVVITARHAQQLNEVVDGIRAKGGKAVGVVADVCATEDTKKVFETALREFGDVDILINNAGIGEQKMIDETDDDWMMYVMNTNLGGPMRYIREALKIFLPKNDGVIINISSVNGARPFCGATGGLNTLTRMWPCGLSIPIFAVTPWPRCYHHPGASGQQSRGAARRRRDAEIQRPFCLLPRPGVRSHGSGLRLPVPGQQDGEGCPGSGHPGVQQGIPVSKRP